MVVAFPVQNLAKVKDIINTWLDRTKYRKLTNKLKQLFSRSPYSQWTALHVVPPLQANQHPSDLSAVLHSCVQGLDTNNSMFLSLFLSKLPASVRLQCTAKDIYNKKKKVNIMDVSANADKCMDKSSMASLPLSAFNIQDFNESGGIYADHASSAC